MKYLFVFIFSLMMLNSNAELNPSEDLSKIKRAMILAVENSKITDSLYAELIKRKAPSALILAYTGTLEALKAKHSWNPYNKVSYVARSQQTLEKAVKRDPENLEIRFMRFSIQHYTPAFLGYSKELDEDRKVILEQYIQKNFGRADEDLVKNIAAFMISTNRCSAAEVKILKRHSS